MQFVANNYIRGRGESCACWSRPMVMELSSDGK